MKKDLPYTVDEVLRLCAERGFRTRNDVLRKGARVASVDGSGDVVRFFSPEVQSRPWGHDLGGNIGLAMSSGSGEVKFDVAVFHHVLNLPAFGRPSRTLDDPANALHMLDVIRCELEKLPITPSGVVELSNGDTWFAKQLAWDWSSANRLLKLALACPQA